MSAETTAPVAIDPAQGQALLGWLDGAQPAEHGGQLPLWCPTSLLALIAARSGSPVAPAALAPWLLAAGILRADGGLPADPALRQRIGEWSQREFAPLAQSAAAAGRGVWWLQHTVQNDERCSLVATSAQGQLLLLRCGQAELTGARTKLLGILAALCPAGVLLGVAGDHPDWFGGLDALPPDLRPRLLLAAPGQPLPTLAPAATAPVANPAAPAANSERPLFRPQAQARQGERLEGEVLLAQPLSQRLLSAGAGVVVVALIVFASVGRFTKTETAPGVLVPGSGVTKVMVPHAGVVRELRVKVGDVVRAGQPLLTVANSRVSGDGAAVDRQIIAELERTLGTLDEEMQNQVSHGALEQARLREALASARRMASDGNRQRELQTQRMALLQEKQARLQPLFASGVIAAVQARELDDEMLGARLQQAALDRELEAARGRVSEAEAALREQPLRQRSRQAELAQRAAELRQRLAEAQMLAGSQVLAPTSGRVAAVLADSGGRIAPDRPVVLIVDDTEPLVAELWVPTRGAGFLRSGQEVRLKLAAYPYQRFGYQVGRIVQVSETSLDPSEMVGPVRLPEASYAVRVSLDSQSVLAFGEERALQAGMLVDAEIVIDRPRIVDWVLEPLHSLKGRS